MTTAELGSAAWFKSSRSNGNANCVEVAFLGTGRVAMRDSKQREHGPALVVAAAEWTAFTTRARSLG